MSDDLREAAQARMDIDRRQVMDAMHHTGERRRSITAKQWEELYLMADGFGEVDRQFAEEQCWDWSHVRDSSPEALMRMAAQLRDFQLRNMLRNAGSL